MTIYTTSTGEFRTLAEDIADERDEPLVTDTDDLPTEGSIIYVEAPDNISVSTLYTLQKRLLAQGPKNGRFGIITGYDASYARDLYGRNESYGENHGVFVRFYLDEVDPDPTAGIYDKEEMTIGNLEALNEDGLDSLSMYAGGRSYHLGLSDGYVCGFPVSQSLEDYDNQQPYCVRDGEMECPFDARLIHAEDIQASHMFVFACGSLIPEVSPGLPVHVGMGLLSSAETLIGSYRTGPGTVQETFLHYNLVRAGYDMSERCYLLNQNAHATGLKAYPYVGFGRPESTSETAVDQQYDVSIEGGDSSRVRITDVDAHIIDVEVPEALAPTTDDRYYVTQTGDSERLNGLYYAAFDEGDSVRLILYSEGRIETPEITLELSGTPTRWDDRQIVKTSLERGKHLEKMGMLTERAEQNLEEIERQLRVLPKKTDDEGHDTYASEKIDNRIETLFGHLNVVHEEVASIATKGRGISREVGSEPVIQDGYVDDQPCYHCGRPVYVMQYGNGEDAQRTMGKCPYCEVVYDTPTTKDDDHFPHHPVLSGDTAPDAGTERSLTLTFENPLEVPMEATFYPAIYPFGDETPNGAEPFSPKSVSTRLAPSEEKSVDFTLDVSVLGEYEYTVFGPVIGNLDVYSTSIKVELTDTRGFPRALTMRKHR